MAVGASAILHAMISPKIFTARPTTLSWAVAASLLFTSPLAAQGASPADTPISEAELAADIGVLSSDAFEGRGPASAGEARTIAHIVGSWAAAGLQPLAGSATPWLQPVPLVTIHQGPSRLDFVAQGQKLLLDAGDMVLHARTASVRASAAPLIFVGYGVDAQGQIVGDVAGKVVMILAADPPFGKDAPSLAKRRALLAAAGAIAMVTVADTDRPWAMARASLPAQFTRRDDGRALMPFEALLSQRAFDRIITAAGRKTASLRQSAASAEYRGDILPLVVDIQASADVRHYQSHNVLAKLAGAQPDGKAVILMGHWDGLGICEPDGPDKICNGAVDNASGIAVINAVAKRLAAGPRPDRDIYFLATTAEEKGLHGAFHFVENAPLPLSDIIVALNLDTVAIAPRGTPVAVIGRGRPAYDALVAKVAKAVGRQMDRDGEGDEFVTRQDGWAFGAKDVPALMVGGSFSDMGALGAYLGSSYHRPDDQVASDGNGAAMPLGGAAEDGDLHVQLIRAFASPASWPAHQR